LTLSPEFAFPLDHRVILVTGGASGIGLATVRMALTGGAKVVAVDVNNEALSALRGSAGTASDRLMAEAMDVTDAGAIASTLAKAREVFGVVDGLVCSAGVSIESPLLEVTPELWRRHIDLNLTGTFNIAQSVARDLVANGRTGSIVTVSSAQGFRGRQHSAPYVASKAGVLGLTKALALDLAADGVRVNCVAPGAVETPLMRSVVERAPGGIEAALARIPMGRIGQPEDIAAPICFLLSDAAGWMTGQTLHVNGGSLVV
jgi:NAD(P)-dependent dehydrogenase (short-subunit alcohol dehydrogenase family)